MFMLQTAVDVLSAIPDSVYRRTFEKTCGPCCKPKAGLDTSLTLKNNSNFRLKAEWKEFFKPSHPEEPCDEEYFDHDDEVTGQKYAHHEVVLEAYHGSFDENGVPEESDDQRIEEDNMIILETEENDGIRQGLMSADTVYIYKLAENEDYPDTRTQLMTMEVTAQVGPSYEEMNACDFDPECARIVIKNNIDKELDIHYLTPLGAREHYDTIKPGEHFVSHTYLGTKFIAVHPSEGGSDAYCEVNEELCIHQLTYWDFGLPTPEVVAAVEDVIEEIAASAEGQEAVQEAAADPDASELLKQVVASNASLTTTTG